MKEKLSLKEIEDQIKDLQYEIIGLEWIINQNKSLLEHKKIKFQELQKQRNYIISKESDQL